MNGFEGYNIDMDGLYAKMIAWDNGDYILELSGDLPKNELIVLAKTAKKIKIKKRA